MTTTVIDLGFRPHVYQRQVQAGLTEHSFAVVVAHRRWGKALDIETPVPLADGRWATMGKIRAGDEVIGSDGRAVKVLFAHPVMHERECYRLTFASGETIVADSEHLWVTTRKCDRHHWPGRGPTRVRNEPRPAATRTTAEIARTLRSRGEWNHRVALVAPVEYSERDLPLDPYLLGQWLGDGSTRASEITTADPETVQEITVRAAAHGWTVRDQCSQSTGRASTYRVNGGMQVRLREMGVLGEKHIPDCYQRASIAQRTELLHGLMDSDGAISTQGHYCEITQKSERLAQDIVRLLRSLGMQPRCGVKRAMGRDYVRIKFRPLMQVFSLPRKAARYRPPPERLRWQAIVGCERVTSRSVRCLTVDAPDGQFAVGHYYTLTHNTRLAIALLVDRALRCERHVPRYAYVAPRLKQARQIAWQYLTELAALIPGSKRSEAESWVELPNAGRITLYGGSEGNEESMRGLYLDGVVIDEVAGMAPHVFPEILRPALTDRKGWALFIGTPHGADAFLELWTRAQADRDWFTALYRADETELPWLPKSELAAARRDMSDAAYRQEFLADFTASSSDTLITIDIASAAAQREYVVTHYGFAPVVIGVDVARFGDDRSVIQARQGLMAYAPQIYQGIDTMTLSGHVARAIDQHSPQAVFVDVGGMGAGVVDRLRQLGYRTIEVNFGGKSGDATYADKRTEMWFGLRDWLNQGGSIPNLPQLKTDLCGPTYEFIANGRVKLERKDDLKARGLPSPDLGDALALTFAEPVFAVDRFTRDDRRYPDTAEM